MTERPNPFAFATSQLLAHCASAIALPTSLNEAITAAQDSQLARGVLGDMLFEKFLANKRAEWENYRAQVHQYELDRYLSIL